MMTKKKSELCWQNHWEIIDDMIVLRYQYQTFHFVVNMPIVVSILVNVGNNLVRSVVPSVGRTRPLLRLVWWIWTWLVSLENVISMRMKN